MAAHPSSNVAPGHDAARSRHEPLFLGVDIGTSSAKGVLSTATGTVLASAVRPSTVSTPRPGHVEMDAESQWWDAFVAITRELVDRADGARIAAVCVSGLGPCLLPTDAEFNPLRPGILYGIDSRAGEQVDRMTAEVGPATVLERCGKDLSSQAVGPKLAWLREHEPHVWERMRAWVGSHTFVVARLTGNWVLDHHTASQCDPFYDVRGLDWAHDIVERLLPDLQLPRLVWPHEIVGSVTADAARQCGLPAGTPVAGGTVDAWAEAFSSGVRDAGDLMVMYGSTMFLVQVLPEPTTRSGLWTTAGVVPGTHTISAGMSTSGTLLDWTRSVTGTDSFDTLLRRAAAVPAGADGLVVLPYFAGERSPIYDADARGMIIGLTLGHGQEHVFRAALEGAAFGMRQIFAELEGVVGTPRSAVAVGGGVRGTLWPQIVCDVTGVPQEIPAVTIGASYGDALLAAIGSGSVGPDTRWATVARVLQPDPTRAAVYDELYDVFRSLYPATRDQMHRLSAVQRSGGAPRTRST